jgi:uncharacterized protein
MVNENGPMLRYQVTDLLTQPGLSRPVGGELPLQLKVGETVVDDVAEVVAQLDSIPEGIIARGSASTIAHHVCARCLMEWDGPIEVEFTELFARRSGTKLADEDLLRVSSGGFIDLGPLVHDEVSLSLPADPLCKPDCLGLCPTCGADLNVSPCAGHGDQSSSPFAALNQLFGSET